MSDAYKRTYRGTISKVKLKKMSQEELKALFTKDEWADMLELMRESLEVGAKSPVRAFELQRKIVKTYAEPVIGQRAQDILGVLAKEVRGGEDAERKGKARRA